MPLPPEKFGDGQVWDGTTPRARPTTDVYKAADGEIGNRHSSEIIALEGVLSQVLEELELLTSPGAANSLLGVKNDQSGLEYKTLIEGANITITHANDTITFASTGGGGGAGVEIDCTAGEAVTIGDVLYLATNGKAYKAQANANITSKVVGCSNKTASQDEAIKIITIGAVTNPSWTLLTSDIYYLSPYVAGAITSTPPSLAGNYLVPVGIAITATQLAISLRTRVLM